MTSMEYTRLGNTGLKVSKIIMGCMVFGTSKWEGAPWTLDEEDGLELLKKAYDCGINTWDTADMYSNGESERIVGKALKRFSIPRSKVVIMTKIWSPIVEGEGTRLPFRNDGPALNQMGLSRKHVFRAVDDCLRRLDTDYIDVLQIHRYDNETPPEETMRALHEVVTAGKVRYLGASSMPCWKFARMQHIAERYGWTKFVSMQPFYNLAYREEEREMIPFCRETGVAVIPWSPLGRGLLARPLGNTDTARSKGDQASQILNRTVNPEIITRVEQLATEKGTTMAVIATAWVLHKGCWPIIGMNKEERIKEAIKALDVRLTEEEIQYLEKEYKPREVHTM